jgi:Lon protease-like protein
MAEVTLPSFPLFPLGIVALPSERIPLHIFEDRYLRMIQDCLASEGEVGILWLSGDELKQVGCACEIDELSDRADEGRLDVLVRGTRPFRLLDREDDLPYPAGTIQFLTDVEDDPDPNLADDAHQLYADLFEQATDRTIEGSELESMTAYGMAATVEFGADAKQQLLELRSESSRLRLLVRLLRAAIKRLELIERARTRAVSNGKVRFG